MDDNVRKSIYIYIYMWMGHFAIQQKLTEHCKLTITEKIKILQKKKKKEQAIYQTPQRPKAKGLGMEDIHHLEVLQEKPCA